MTLKNVQGMYKKIVEDLASTSIDQTNTPSKRNTKEGLAKSAEHVITSNKNHM